MPKNSYLIWTKLLTGRTWTHTSWALNEAMPQSQRSRLVYKIWKYGRHQRRKGDQGDPKCCDTLTSLYLWNVERSIYACRTVTWSGFFYFSPLYLLKWLFTVSLRCCNEVFMQNSDLASLGRRTGAIETLVGQLREAAEATNLPHQEEGKGEFLHLIPLIHLIHWPKKSSCEVIFSSFNLVNQCVQSNSSVWFVCASEQ